MSHFVLDTSAARDRMSSTDHQYGQGCWQESRSGGKKERIQMVHEVVGDSMLADVGEFSIPKYKCAAKDISFNLKLKVGKGNSSKRLIRFLDRDIPG